MEAKGTIIEISKSMIWVNNQGIESTFGTRKDMVISAIVKSGTYTHMFNAHRSEIKEQNIRAGNITLRDLFLRRLMEDISSII